MLVVVDREIRRAALRQTARMVFGVGAFACSGQQTQSGTQVEPLPSVTAQPAQTAQTHSLPTAPMCAIGLDADGGLLPGSLKCCLDATRHAAKPGNGRASGAAWSSERPDLTACCHAIADGNPRKMMSLAYSEEWNVDACHACAVVIGDNGMACTPWGPPMPPAMPPPVA